MPKDHTYTTPPAGQLDEDGRALIAAFTAAILSAKADASPINEDAKAAADQYRQIRLALRTHAEPLPQPQKTAASATATSST